MDGGRPRLKIADGVPEWVICHRASERRPACAAEQRVDAGTTFNEIVTAGTDDGVVAAMADQPVATVATKNVVTPATEAIEVIGAPIAAFDDVAAAEDALPDGFVGRIEGEMGEQSVSIDIEPGDDADEDNALVVLGSPGDDATRDAIYIVGERAVQIEHVAIVVCDVEIRGGFERR